MFYFFLFFFFFFTSLKISRCTNNQKLELCSILFGLIWRFWNFFFVSSDSFTRKKTTHYGTHSIIELFCFHLYLSSRWERCLSWFSLSFDSTQHSCRITWIYGCTAAKTLLIIYILSTIWIVIINLSVQVWLCYWFVYTKPYLSGSNIDSLFPARSLHPPARNGTRIDPAGLCVDGLYGRRCPRNVSSVICQ